MNDIHDGIRECVAGRTNACGGRAMPTVREIKFQHSNCVFHYTTWSKLAKIVEEGVLKPSAIGAPGEAPILWFSRHPKWEPTATKLFRGSAGITQMSFPEMVERFGAVRFAIADDHPDLMPWLAACEYAGTPTDVRERLEHVGRMKGANPAHWFGMATELAIEGLAFQVYLERRWHLAEPAEMVEVWLEHESSVRPLP